MYPYPSGDLHIGHWYAATGPDIVARMHRMRGFNVMFPMGFDSFGLPAENAAIDRGIDPAEWTNANIERMRTQFRTMGAMFDWSREVVTSDPDYYRWTQWIFLQFYKAGLAYRALGAVDWCPKDQVVLAREQVLGTERRCWRCNTPVVKRDLEQWWFRITNYSDELLDYSGIDYPEPIRLVQTNWIGRSEGAEIDFARRGRRRRADPRLHHPPGHGVRRDVHGARAGAPARVGADDGRPARRGRGLRRQRAARDRDRADEHGARADRRLHRRVRRSTR